MKSPPLANASYQTPSSHIDVMKQCRVFVRVLGWALGGVPLLHTQPRRGSPHKFQRKSFVGKRGSTCIACN